MATGVMVGGNLAGDGEGCSLSFELYCCYRFPISKKDSPLYWPTTSMNVCLNHTGQQKPFPHSAIHNRSDAAEWFCCVCVCVCLFGVITCMHEDLMHGCVFVHPHSCICVFCLYRIVCEMAEAPKGSAPGPVKLCVGECRPELRAQSSQLYSFVVILTLSLTFTLLICM